VLVVVVLLVAAADDADCTVGDVSLSELHPNSRTNAHVPTATARRMTPT